MNTFDTNPFLRTGVTPAEYQISRRNKADKIVRLIDEFLIDISQVRALDIGCFDGSMTLQFASHIGRIVGTDIDLSTLQNCARHLSAENLNFVAYNGNSLPFSNNSFDLLIVNHVLYYVDDQPAFLREVKRIMASNGLCYLSVINGNYTAKILRLPHWLQPIAANIVFGSPVNFGHPVSLEKYERMLIDFSVDNITLKTFKEPLKYAKEFNGWRRLVLVVISRMPEWFIKTIARWSPTHIFVLRKPDSQPVNAYTP